MMQKTVNFQVRANEIDANGRVAFHNLVNYFQEAAWLHVIDLGITGAEMLEKYNLMWVLSRMKIEIFRYPALHETLTVRTFPSGLDKFFFYRDLRLYDAADTLIAQASSTWLLVDFLERKMSIVPDFLKEMVLKINRTDGLPPAKGKLKTFTNADFEHKVTVRWFDLDPNQHVNHVWYLKWLLEGLPDVLHQHQVLRQFDVQFKAEARLGEILTIQAIDEQNDCFLHQILNQDGKLLISAQSVWE